MKRLLVTIGVLIGLIPVAALAAPTFVQEHCRWRNDDGSETSATWKVVQDTALTGVGRGQNIRLRFGIANTNTASGSINPIMEFSTNTAGPWTQVSLATNGLSAFEMTPSGNFAYGDATTALLAGSGSFVAGMMVEYPQNAAPSALLAASKYSNFEYCFRPTAKARGNMTYYFRLSGMNTYSRYATLTMEAMEANEPPEIVSALSAQASVVTNFEYAITATGSEPVTYNAAGLPAGLSFDGTNRIRGLVTTAGTYPATISATSAWGVDTRTLSIVAGANVAPVASNQVASVAIGAETEVILPWSDADQPQLTAHTFSIVANPLHGTLTSYFQRTGVANNPNVYYYRAATNYIGNDAFTWKCNDGTADSNIGTATVSSFANQKPAANNGSLTTASSQQASYTLSYTHTDIDQTLTFTIVSQPSHGSVTLTGGTIAYVSNPGYAGSDSFTWKCNDGVDDSNIAIVSITVTASLPVPQNQTAAIAKNTAVDIPALYTGGGGYSYSVVKVTGPAHGVLTTNGTTFNYTPTSGYMGPDSFTWRMVYNGTGTTATVTCSLSVKDSVYGTDWPMWRYDHSRDGATPNTLPAQLYLQWRRDFRPIIAGFTSSDTRYEYCHEPVVMGKRLFVPSSSEDNLTAVDTDTGAILWTFRVDGPIRTAPVAVNGKVYVAADDSYLYCLNAADGSLAWKFRGGPNNRKTYGNRRVISTWPCRSGPVYKNGRICFAAGLWSFEGMFVYALDADTGAVVWRNDTDYAISSINPHADGPVPASSPSLQGYMVITDSGTRLRAAAGHSIPAEYDLATGVLPQYRSDSVRNHAMNSYYLWLKSADPAWYDLWFDMSLYYPGRPTAISVGARTFTVTDAAVLGAGTGVQTMLAGDNKLFAVTSGGSIYCFGGTQVTANAYPLVTTPLPAVSDSWTTLAGQILSQSAVGTSGQGVCLVWGTGTGRLTKELVKQGQVHVVAFDPDTNKVATLRSELTAAGLYGSRASVHAGNPPDEIFTPTMARLLVCEDVGAAGIGVGQPFAEKIYRALRPNGGSAWLYTSDAQHTSIAGWVTTAGLGAVQVTRAGNCSVLTRTGLPKPIEQYVKPPFGILYYETGNSFLTLMGYSTVTNGASVTQTNLMTRTPENAFFFRDYGCAGAQGYGNVVLMRSGCGAVNDMYHQSGTIHIGNARPVCDLPVNQYSDGSEVLQMDGCSCAYPIRATAALVPMPADEQENWQSRHRGRVDDTIEEVPLRRVGFNFGAPGDSTDENGTLWLGRPHWTGPSPMVQHTLTPPVPERYSHHFTWLEGGSGPKWVMSSGVKGLQSAVIKLAIAPTALRATNAPVINGQLEDTCWNGEKPIDLLYDYALAHGQARQKAWLRYDDNNLYVAFHAFGYRTSHPFTMDLSDRDQVGGSTGIKKVLRYTITGDGTVSGTGRFMAAGFADESQFTAEISIPWTTLETEGFSKDKLIVNLIGADAGTGEGWPNLRDPVNSGSYWGGRQTSSTKFCPIFYDAPRGVLASIRPYKVRLYFAEPENIAVGARVFDVKLQGATVLSNFDIVQAAGGVRRGVTREFNISVQEDVALELVPKVGTPVISGVEMINVTADGSNMAPVAIVKADTARGTVPATIGFSAMNSYDPDDAPLTYSWNFGDGQNGTGRTNRHTYAAAGNYTATLTVSDGRGGTASVSTNIQVRASNQLPAISASSPASSFAMNEGASQAFSVTATDGNGDALSYLWKLDGGTILNAASSLYTYTPDFAAASNHALIVVISDGFGGVVTQTWAVTVNNLNRAPVAAGTSVGAYLNTPARVLLVATDPDGAVLSFNVTAQPQHGVLTGSGPECTYTPNVSYTGPDIVKFTATDGALVSAEATVTISVSSSNDPGDFVCSLRATGGDYDKLSTWENANKSDLTAASSMIFGVSDLGTHTKADDGTAVAFTGGGAGTLKHINLGRKAYVTGCSGTIQSGTVTCASGRTFVIANTGTQIGRSIVECYNDWPASGLSDHTYGTGWTANSNHYVVIRAAAGHRHNGTVRSATGLRNYTGFAIKNVNLYADPAIGTPSYSRVEGIIILGIKGLCGNGGVGLALGNNSTADSVIAFSNDPSHNWNGIALQNNAVAMNCLAYNMSGSGFVPRYESGGLRFYNCTAVGCGTGFAFGNVFSTANQGKNCLAADCGRGFSGRTNAPVPVVSYCASSDGSSTNWGGAGNRVNQTFKFVDAANEDFHLATDDAGAVGYGADMSADSFCAFNKDVDGETRVTPWDIGMDEAPTGTPTAPTITSALTASGEVGTTFSYTITASGTAPITFGASGLPAGLTRMANVISGSPTVAGSYNVTLTASNSVGVATRTLVLTVDAGVDAYGIPDTWRVLYFGSAIATNAGALVDADGDGMSNLAEYVAGTNPTNVLSCLRCGVLAGQGSAFQVTFPTVAGRLYSVQYNDDLRTTNWGILTNNMTGSGSTAQVSDPALADKRFYRIGVKLQ